MPVDLGGTLCLGFFIRGIPPFSIKWFSFFGQLGDFSFQIGNLLRKLRWGCDVLCHQILELLLIAFQPDDFFANRKSCPVGRLCPSCTAQQIHISEIECEETGDLPFGITGQLALHTIALRMIDRLLWLLGRAAALSHEPLLDGFFGIAFAQAVQTDKSLATGWAYSGVLPVGAAFDLIAVSLQQQEKGLVGIGFSDDTVNVLPDDAPHGGSAILLRLPFAVVLALALRSDDRQPVFTAQIIRYFLNLLIIAFWIGMIFLSVHV